MVAGSGARRRAVFLELCLNVLNLAQRLRLNAVQTSCLFSLMHVTHLACCECVGSSMVAPSMASGFELFQTLLLKHSVERPPFSVGVFRYEQVKAIVQFATNHYFRYLKLFQYVFATSFQLQIHVQHSTAERSASFLSYISPSSTSCHPALLPPSTGCFPSAAHFYFLWF